MITVSYIVMFLAWLTVCNGSKTPQLNEVLLEKLLVGLEKAYNFYESDYEDVNLDGIYGLRVSQGALLKVLEEQKSGKLNIKKSILSRISKLERKAASIADKSLPKLKQSNPGYYKRFETTVAVPWKNFKPFKRLDYSLYVPANKRSEISFDEDTSDHCMTELTGTGELPQKPCQLSGRCWNLMMAKGAEGYALTHQALFLLIGEVQGCKKALQHKLKSFSSASNLQQVYDRICASMYPQMVEFEKTNKNSFQYERDLYMEQAMVCGSMGYYEFLSAKRLQKILEWQKKSGCFGDIENKQEDESKKTDISHADNNKKTLKEGLEENLYDHVDGYDFKVGANSRKLTSMRTMRTLLVEKALGGGCMSHITGVATGLLGVYLRWAVHMMYPGDKQTIKPTTNQISQDSARQNNRLPNLLMRKIMQNEPLLVDEMQPGDQRMFKTGYLLMAVLCIVLLLGYGVFAKKRLARGLGAIFQFRKKLSYFQQKLK